MALKEDLRNNAGLGIFIGVGAVLVAPLLIPILKSVARPLARTAIKGGLMLYDKGKEKAAEAGEIFEDLFAEVREELSRETDAAVAFASGGQDEGFEEPPQFGEGEGSSEAGEGEDAS